MNNCHRLKKKSHARFKNNKKQKKNYVTFRFFLLLRKRTTERNVALSKVGTPSTDLLNWDILAFDWMEVAFLWPFSVTSLLTGLAVVWRENHKSRHFLRSKHDTPLNLCHTVKRVLHSYILLYIGMRDCSWCLSHCFLVALHIVVSYRQCCPSCQSVLGVCVVGLSMQPWQLTLGTVHYLLGVNC